MATKKALLSKTVTRAAKAGSMPLSNPRAVKKQQTAHQAAYKARGQVSISNKGPAIQRQANVRANRVAQKNTGTGFDAATKAKRGRLGKSPFRFGVKD